MTPRAPASIFTYDADRASRADKVITELVESRGIDKHWRLAHTLLAVCESESGRGVEDVLPALVERLTLSQRKTLLRLLAEAADG